jgi:hypothetical protein
MNYLVSFMLDKKERDENFAADNPGAAFALALKKYPDATLLSATVLARIGRQDIGKVNYTPPPPRQRPLTKRITLGPRKPRKGEPHGELF